MVWFVLLVITAFVFCGDYFLQVGEGYNHREAIDCDITFDSVNCRARHVNIKDVCRFVHNNSYIKVLMAGENNLGRLTMDMLEGCENLHQLDLHFNQIVRIEKDTFSKFKSLEVLDLRANNLDIYYDTFALKDLPKSLKELRLGGNFPNQPWKHNYRYPDISALKNLENLYLDGIESDFLNGYENIKSLSLTARTRFTFCNITSITNTTFSNLTSVEYLDLSFCNISIISAGAFEHLHNLTHLNLALNLRLGFSALGVFSYGLQFTNIRFLNYSHVYPTFGIGTELKKEHICYLKNTSLATLAIDGNKIVSIEANAVLLVPETLEELYMNDNKPSFGPYLSQFGCFSNLKSFYGNNQNKYHEPSRYVLESVFKTDTANDTAPPSECKYLSDEILRNISKHAYNCPYIDPYDFKKIFSPTLPANLRHAEFSNCKMSYNLDVRLKLTPGNNSLQTADLSGNGLYSLTGPVGPLPNARNLSLSNNYCEYIGPDFFKEMGSLLQLDLSMNFLGPYFAENENAAKHVFEGLTKLAMLNLSLNKITTLFPETLAPLTSLETLYLNDNSIKLLDSALSFLDSLLVLDLANNSLSTLSEALCNKIVDNSRRLNKNFSIDLTGNELRADCNTTDFLRWIYKYRNNMNHFENYVYVGELATGIKTLNDTNLDQLEQKCLSYIGIIIVCSIILAIFFSVVIVGIVYRNRWKIRYFLYMSKAGVFGYQRLAEQHPPDYYRFDAFISYAEENLRFIMNGIIPNIEEQGENVALCVHQRDFLAGNAISENIIEAIRKSRKTVIVLSKMFIRKKWCMYEFNMARMESIYSRDDRNHIVVVMLENIPARDMPLEMVEWIRDNSYIEYTTDEQGEILFWNNLKSAIMT